MLRLYLYSFNIYTVLRSWLDCKYKTLLCIFCVWVQLKISYMFYIWIYVNENIYWLYICYQGFPGGSDSKESACNVGDLGLIPGSGRSPGEGNGNPLQYSCLENAMDGGAWQSPVHGFAKSQTRLSDFTITIYLYNILNI